MAVPLNGVSLSAEKIKFKIGRAQLVESTLLYLKSDIARYHGTTLVHCDHRFALLFRVLSALN